MNQAWIRALPSFIRKGLDERQNLQIILANTGWLSVDRILRLGVGLIVGVWVARYLGPDQFGLYNYAIAFVFMFSVLSTLGLDSIVVRDIVREPTCKDEILGTAFVLKLTGGTIALAVIVVTIPVFRPDYSMARLLVGIIAAGFVFQAFDTVDFWFQSQVKSKNTIYAKDGAFCLIALVKIGLIQLRAPLVAFAWAGLAETVLGVIGLVIVYRINGHSLKEWRPSLIRAKVLLKSSWPLMISAFGVLVYMRIDQIMLGSMVNDRAVGIYSAAVKLSEIWYIIPVIIYSSVLPSIVEAKKADERLYYMRLQKLFNLTVALAYVVAFPITIFSGKIVLLIYGQRFAEAGPMLAILVWAGVFVSLGVIRETWVVSEGKTGFLLAATLTGALSNVGLNLLFIPKYGAIAASVNTVFSQFVATTLCTFLYPKTRRIFNMQLRSLLLYGGVRFKYDL
jgi:PST family polysaccharide transporter